MGEGRGKREMGEGRMKIKCDKRVENMSKGGGSLLEEDYYRGKL